MDYKLSLHSLTALNRTFYCQATTTLFMIPINITTIFAGVVSHGYLKTNITFLSYLP